MIKQQHSAGRRAVRLAVLAGLLALLGACEGITPVTSAPASTGPQELDPKAPGVLSGDGGAIILYEKK